MMFVFSGHMAFIQCRIDVDKTSSSLYNVALTSMQRYDVASTSMQRCIDVTCKLDQSFITKRSFVFKSCDRRIVALPMIFSSPEHGSG